MKKLVLAVMLTALMTTTALTQQAEATPKKVKVTYIENGGKNVKDQTVSKNTNPKEPKVTRNGYTFKGWYTDKKLTKKWDEKSNKATKNTTLYAKWAKKKYTVTYDSSWWKVNVPSTKVSYGTNLKEPKPKKTGCVFMGWYTDKEFTKAWDAKNGKVTKNMTLYGKWDYEVKASDFEIRNGVLIAYRGKAVNVTVPNGVTRIDEYSFRNTVKNVTLPNSVTSIAENAFDPQYSKLTSINIPSNLTNIGDNAFGRNNPVLKITNNSYASKWAYENGYRHTVNGSNIKKGAPYKIKNGVFLGYYADAGNVVIPNGVTTIGYHAFYFNDKITSITFPSSVKSIEREAFYFADNLTSVTFSEGLERIEPYAFSYTKIKTVNIPSTVTYISDYAFSYINPTFKITNNAYAVSWAKKNGYGYTDSASARKSLAPTVTTVEQPKDELEVNNVKDDIITTDETSVQKEVEQVTVEETTNDTKKEVDTSEDKSAVENNETSNDLGTNSELNNEQ